MAERLTMRDEKGEAYVPLKNPKPPYPLVTDDAVEKLAHYEDLEEAGRLVILPEDMDLKKLIKCTDGDGLCPRDVGLADRCELSCLECWLAALKGAENEGI